MKYFSTFSGIGGFELAMPSEWECVGFSEIDKYAIQIYNKHFPKHKNYGDITKINTESIPSFDLLVGGFPCQAFSMAGKRRGFEDTRGTLFFELARILKDKRPTYFIFENVKGLLSHNNGNTFKTIIATLDELGYDLQWQVLNSKNFGVPQNRERVFIVGHLRGTSWPEVFPIWKDTGEIDELQEQEQGVSLFNPYECKHRNISKTLNTGCGSPTTKNGQVVVRKKIKSSARGFGSSGSLVDKDDITPTLTTSMGTGGNNVPMVKENQIRRLTPVECERLQGFPDGWTDCVSDTQRYKTLGNAVTVNTVKAIMDKLLTNLN